MKNTILYEDMEYINRKLTSKEKEKFSDSTVLVTGCGGFLGYYFMHYLANYAQGLNIKRVIGLDNFMLRKPEWIDELVKIKGLEIHQFDIITDKIDDIYNAGDADFIVHMASIASPTYYRKHPIETLDANVWGLRSLLDFYMNKSVKGVLFFSSSEIYGDPLPEFIPTNEEYKGNVSCIGPRACYDEAKRFGETICYIFSQQYNLPVSIVRPFNNYGPGMNLEDKRVPADFAKAVIEGRDIEMYSDGTPTRTFCYVADAIAGYLKALLHGRFDFFNIGIDKPEISVRDLADLYIKAGQNVFGYRGKAVFSLPPEKEYLTHNPNRRCPDIEKAKKTLDYNPEITVEAGIERFLRFLKLEA